MASALSLIRHWIKAPSEKLLQNDMSNMAEWEVPVLFPSQKHQFRQSPMLKIPSQERGIQVRDYSTWLKHKTTTHWRWWKGQFHITHITSPPSLHRAAQGEIPCRWQRRVKWIPDFVTEPSSRPSQVNPSARLAPVAPGFRPVRRAPESRPTPALSHPLGTQTPQLP